MFQIGATLLEACVLSILSDGDTYGYILTQNAREIINVAESTLYPVLRRLQKSGDLTMYDMPYEGRLRRYYKITDKGLETLKTYRKEWLVYRAKVNRMLMVTEVNNYNEKV